MNPNPNRLYYYAPQRRAVEEFIFQIGSNPKQAGLTAISEHTQLYGLRCITFAVVENHMNIIPDRMWGMLRERGAIVVRINDEYARLKAEHLHRG